MYITNIKRGRERLGSLVSPQQPFYKNRKGANSYLFKGKDVSLNFFFKIITFFLKRKFIFLL